jgi:hypothetical protein
MSPSFINTNSHYIYLDLPSRDEDLTRIRAFEKIKLTGADADVAEETNGVVNLDTCDKQTKADVEARIVARELAGIGAKPASEEGDYGSGKAAKQDPGKGGAGPVTTADVKGESTSDTSTASTTASKDSPKRASSKAKRSSSKAKRSSSKTKRSSSKAQSKKKAS